MPQGGPVVGRLEGTVEVAPASKPGLPPRVLTVRPVKVRIPPPLPVSDRAVILANLLVLAVFALAFATVAGAIIWELTR